MATYRVRKSVTRDYEMYIEADSWEEAEEKAMYADEDEWTPSAYEIEPEFDVDEEV